MSNENRREYDSVSIAPSQAETLVNDDGDYIYSATGRRQPPYNPSAYANHPGIGFVPNAPQHVPFSFTDDTLIHVTVALKPADNRGGESSTLPKKPSLLSAIKTRIQTGTSAPTTPFKVVKMPRREYLKYFAKDTDGNYVGSEPRREWTEELLEEEFGRWKDAPAARWVINVQSGIQGR